MTPDRWKEVKRAFDRVSALRRVEQEEVLRLTGHADPELAGAVRDLLRSDDSAGEFLEPPDPAELEQPMRRLTFDFRGSMLGEFELIEEIGRGASGTVFLGRQPALGRDVAIKILAPHLCHSEDRRARFEREALAASKVRHPNVVSVLSYGEQSGVVYLVMEYVAGFTLHQHLEQLRASEARPMEPREAARIAGGVARGLAACHRAGVIHRDVKPQNILLDAQLEPRIVDFGLAKDQNLGSLSQSGSLSGTPQYMSPEQARAEGCQVDWRTDIYSLGAVLYELLTLRPPVSAHETILVLQEVLRNRIAPVRAVSRRVPRSLAAVCMRALSKEPAGRYRSADALADELARFQSGRVVHPGLRWILQERLSTLIQDQPWVLPAAVAIVLTSLPPHSKPSVEAGQSHSQDPSGKAAAALKAIQELEAQFSDIPLYPDPEEDH